MENLDTNELIEQYLNGSLPPAEQQAVEARLTTDAVFRAEVELHRQMHEELADPRKLQLRDLLGDIVREPPPPPPANYGWLTGPGIALAVLLALWMGWRWLSPAPEPTSAPVQQDQNKIDPQPSEPIAQPEIRKEPSEPVEKRPEGPIAMADPKAFEPNRGFEDRLGSNLRASGGSAEMQNPAMGADFTPKNGLVKINFVGHAPVDADTARHPLVLNIYSNLPASGQPLYRVLPSIGNRSTATDKWTFSSSQRLPLKPGLYYFTVERQADEDMIFVGKFTVGAQK